MLNTISRYRPTTDPERLRAFFGVGAALQLLEQADDSNAERVSLTDAKQVASAGSTTLPGSQLQLPFTNNASELPHEPSA